MPTMKFTGAYRIDLEDRIQRLQYDWNKKVTDIRQRGCRIETSYGEIDLVDDADAKRVSALVARILERHIHRAERQLAAVNKQLAAQSGVV